MDFGELHYLAQSVAVAIRKRKWEVVRITLADIWWSRYRGTYNRFTFADYVRLWMRRRR